MRSSAHERAVNTWRQTVIKIKHREIEIEYDENSDRWVFTLRGRERKVESLAKAKEIIDKPELKTKKAFERIKCFSEPRYGADNEFEEIEVTSIAAPSRYSSRQEVWIVNKKKGREKRYAEDCFPITDANRNCVKEIESLNIEMDAIRTRRDKIIDKLTPLTIETDSNDE